MNSARVPLTGRRLARGAAGLAAAAVALVVVAGCSSTAAPAPAPSGAITPSADPTAKPATVTIATPTPQGSPAGVPIWIGQENGFFAAEGLTVKVVTFPGQPAQAVAAVTAGQADLVISAPDALIVPTAKGTDLGLTWIFTPYQAPTNTIVVKEGSAIKTVADLAGKKVGMPSTGAPFETFLDTNVKDEGGDPSGITAVALAPAAALQQLDAGSIDAVVLAKSDLAQASVAGGYKTTTLALSDKYQQAFGAGFMMRTNATADQKDAYTRYLRAYIESAIFAQENPAAAIKMNWDLYPASKPAGQSDDASIAALTATVNDFVPAADGTWGLITGERWDAYVAHLGLSSALPDTSKLHDDSLLKGISDFDADQVKAIADSYGK